MGSGSFWKVRCDRGGRMKVCGLLVVVVGSCVEGAGMKVLGMFVIGRNERW